MSKTPRKPKNPRKLQPEFPVAESRKSTLSKINESKGRKCATQGKFLRRGTTTVDGVRRSSTCVAYPGKARKGEFMTIDAATNPKGIRPGFKRTTRKDAGIPRKGKDGQYTEEYKKYLIEKKYKSKNIKGFVGKEAIY